MPLFIIDKLPVYLTSKNDAILRSELYGVENITKSYIEGFDKNYYKKAKKLLLQKYRTDKDKFIDEWVRFDLVGEDAKENADYLLYDYCAFHGTGYISEERPDLSKLLCNYTELGDDFSIKKKLYINHFSAPYNVRWRLRGKKGVIVRTMIDKEEINRIVGTLQEFLIISSDQVIRCREEFEVFPLK
jgi:hypothetical protein